MRAVRRLGSILLLSLLAIPASVVLPSTRMAAGEKCAMACDHGTGMACCCSSDGVGTSLRRCATPGDWFLQSSATRAVAPASPAGPLAPAPSGFLVLLTGALLFRFSSEGPEPVPRPLS